MLPTSNRKDRLLIGNIYLNRRFYPFFSYSLTNIQGFLKYSDLFLIMDRLHCKALNKQKNGEIFWAFTPFNVTL